jgi:CRP/FNR family transcriptional regulator, cyclic AMP receptor protein
MKLSTDERAEILRHCRVFSEVPDGTLRVLAEAMNTEVFSAGDIVCAQGEVSDGVYLIGHGICDVLLEGRDEPIATLSAGDLFGEYAMFEEGERSATIRASQRVVLLYLDYARFRAFLMSNPEAMYALFQITVSRLLAAQGNR